MHLFKTLLPITSFIILYFSFAIGLNDFYSVPILPLLLTSLGIGLLLKKEIPLDTKLKAFSNSAGNELIITMILIFLLSGVFSQLGTETGALKILINWTQNTIPPSLFISGIFIFSCVLSMTIGTSVGTIVALAPLAGQVEFETLTTAYFLLGAIVGGAMFGDNLSFISDTTIAVTKTHNIPMREKFKANFRLVLPAAIITLLIYLFLPGETTPLQSETSTFTTENILRVTPYFLVLILAFFGLNLLLTLAIGIIGFALTGLVISNIPFSNMLSVMNAGILSLSELSLIAILLGGLSGLVQLYGGFTLILEKLKKKSTSPRSAGLNIIGLSAFINTLLANNTLAIIIVGPLAKDIAENNEISMKQSASLVDTITCAIQGLLPYGAQLLLAVALSGLEINSFSLAPYVIYPILIGLSSILMVTIRFRNEKME